MTCLHAKLRMTREKIFSPILHLKKEIAKKLTITRSSKQNNFFMPSGMKLVPIDKIKLHEFHEEVRLNKLYTQIVQDGFLKCPLLVLPVENLENSEYFVIDGVHRFNSLRRAGCKQIPVQIIDPDEMTLSTWAHEVPIWQTLENWDLDGSLCWQNELIEGKEWVVAVLDEKGNKRWLTITDPHPTLLQKINYWHRIVNSYLGRTAIKRIPIDNEELPTAGHVRFLYPVWSISAIKAVAGLNMVLPPGTTRFVVRNRLENLHIPLQLLTQSFACEKTLLSGFAWGELLSWCAKCWDGPQLDRIATW